MLVSQLLPNVVKTIKDLVELQRGALEVPCPLAFYKRASGQLPACRCLFPRRGNNRLSDHQWREHVQVRHGDELRILLNTIQDLFDARPQGRADTMPCPLGCKHKVTPIFPDPAADHTNTSPTAPRTPGTSERAANSGAPGRASTYLTAGALEAAAGVRGSTAAPTGGKAGGAYDDGEEALLLGLSQHLLDEHFLELQALAALLDILCLRAFNSNRCPFKVIGPQACTDPDPGPTTATKGRASRAGPGGTGKVTMGVQTESKRDREEGDGATGREGAQHKTHLHVQANTPSMSVTARFLTPRPSSSSTGGAGATRRSGGGREAGTGAAGDANADITAPAPACNWHQHLREAHLRDCIATVRSVVGRCEEAAGAAADAPSPRICCDVIGCAAHFQQPIELFSHLMCHIRPRHANMDEANQLLITASMAAAGSGGGRATASAHRTGGKDMLGPGGATQSGLPLTCPFSILPMVGGSEGGGGTARGGTARPCGCQVASREALEAHAFEQHWLQLEALGTCVSRVGKYHPRTNTHVCPLRELPVHRTKGTATGGKDERSGRRTAGGGGMRDASTGGGTRTREEDATGCDGHDHAHGLFATLREMERHLQVHHIDNFALMASWANGMLAAAAYKAPGAAPSDAGTITASGVRCLLCEDSAETGAEPRPADKVLLGPHIVGAAHMLQHLAEVHPRRLVQVTHCLHLLTAPLPDDSPTCPLGCHHTSQGGKMSLMMHIAEHHAHELFRLSHLAAAEAPLPPSLEWGRANKAQFPDAPRKTWAMQDQASQAYLVTGEQMTGTFLRLLYGKKVSAPPPPPPPQPPPPPPPPIKLPARPTTPKRSGRDKSEPPSPKFVRGDESRYMVKDGQQAEELMARLRGGQVTAAEREGLITQLEAQVKELEEVKAEYAVDIYLVDSRLSHIPDSQLPEVAAEAARYLGLEFNPDLAITRDMLTAALQDTGDMHRSRAIVDSIQASIDKCQRALHALRVFGTRVIKLGVPKDPVPEPKAVEIGKAAVLPGNIFAEHMDELIKDLRGGQVKLVLAQQQQLLADLQQRLGQLEQILAHNQGRVQEYASELGGYPPAELERLAVNYNVDVRAVRDKQELVGSVLTAVAGELMQAVQQYTLAVNKCKEAIEVVTKMPVESGKSRRLAAFQEQAAAAAAAAAEAAKAQAEVLVLDHGAGAAGTRNAAALGPAAGAAVAAAASVGSAVDTNTGPGAAAARGVNVAQNGAGGKQVVFEDQAMNRGASAGSARARGQDAPAAHHRAGTEGGAVGRSEYGAPDPDDRGAGVREGSARMAAAGEGARGEGAAASHLAPGAGHQDSAAAARADGLGKAERAMSGTMDRGGEAAKGPEGVKAPGSSHADAGGAGSGRAVDAQALAHDKPGPVGQGLKQPLEDRDSKEPKGGAGQDLGFAGDRGVKLGEGKMAEHAAGKGLGVGEEKGVRLAESREPGAAADKGLRLGEGKGLQQGEVKELGVAADKGLKVGEDKVLKEPGGAAGGGVRSGPGGDLKGTDKTPAAASGPGKDHEIRAGLEGKTGFEGKAGDKAGGAGSVGKELEHVKAGDKAAVGGKELEHVKAGDKAAVGGKELEQGKAGDKAAVGGKELEQGKGAKEAEGLDRKESRPLSSRDSTPLHERSDRLSSAGPERSSVGSGKADGAAGVAATGPKEPQGKTAEPGASAPRVSGGGAMDVGRSGGGGGGARDASPAPRPRPTPTSLAAPAPEDDDDVLLKTAPDAASMLAAAAAAGAGPGSQPHSLMGTVESMMMPALEDEVVGGVLGGDGMVKRLPDSLPDKPPASAASRGGSAGTGRRYEEDDF